MAISEQQWKGIENALKRQFTMVKLVCDGYQIVATLAQISPTELRIAVYVDGRIKGEWLLEDCEQRRRFMRPIKKSVYSQNQKKAWLRLGKRSLKRIGIDLEEKHIYYTPYWSSARSFIRHLKANNESIEFSEEMDMELLDGCL